MKDPDGKRHRKSPEHAGRALQGRRFVCTTIPGPVVATGGTSGYTYAVTSGLLPAGLSLIGGVITGTPGANTAGTYVLTVTATDSAVPPVTGSVTFQLQVDGGLVVTGTLSTISTVFGTPAAASFLAHRRHVHLQLRIHQFGLSPGIDVTHRRSVCHHRVDTGGDLQRCSHCNRSPSSSPRSQVSSVLFTGNHQPADVQHRSEFNGAHTRYRHGTYHGHHDRQ